MIPDMGTSVPSPPHEFLQVFLQELRVGVAPHFLEFPFRDIPVTFSILRVNPSDRVHEILGMIYSEMQQTKSSPCTVVGSPAVRM